MFFKNIKPKIVYFNENQKKLKKNAKQQTKIKIKIKYIELKLAMEQILIFLAKSVLYSCN
jgi:hypothetical protein